MPIHQFEDMVDSFINAQSKLMNIKDKEHNLNLKMNLSRRYDKYGGKFNKTNKANYILKNIMDEVSSFKLKYMKIRDL